MKEPASPPAPDPRLTRLLELAEWASRDVGMAKRLLPTAGTDPDAWLDAALDRLRRLADELRTWIPLPQEAAAAVDVVTLRAIIRRMKLFGGANLLIEGWGGDELAALLPDEKEPDA